MASFSLSDLAAEYGEKWRSLAIDPAKSAEVSKLTAVILAGKSRYAQVSAATNVPWFVIGIIHVLESGGGAQRFSRHLHNGDPLTDRTFHVPAGRPALGSPPFDWEESASDALEGVGLHNVKNWTVERMAFEFEKYNGMGYREPKAGIASPYLWSFSQHYKIGKFRADGVFDSTLVSKQAGAMVLLKDLVNQGAATLSAPPAVTPPAAAAAGPPPYPGHVIGMDDPDMASVKLVQARLNASGAGQEGRDGNRSPLDVDGEFGPMTEAAVRMFQARSVEPGGTPLIIDGAVGPRTWAALFGGAAAPPPPPAAASGGRQRVIAAAEAQLAKNVLEVPLGSNRGPDVDIYIRSVGLDPAAGSFAWCACFVHFCFQQATPAGQANPFPRTAGVHEAWSLTGRNGFRRIRAAEARADIGLIRAGQVFFLDHGGGMGHVGLIAAVEGETLITIEGNTNLDGGREGIGVFKRKRPIRTVSLGFGDYFK